MGLYPCMYCGNIRESDDGCAENPTGDGLICNECLDKWLTDLPNCPICGLGKLYQEGSHRGYTYFYCDPCEIEFKVYGDVIDAIKQIKSLLSKGEPDNV